MEEPDKCVICLNELRNTNEILTTPCNHVFHSECFLKWMYAHKDCPLCRKQLIKNPTQDEEAYLFQLRQRIEWETIIYENCIEQKKHMDEKIEEKEETLNKLNNAIQIRNNHIVNSTKRRRNMRRTLLFQ
jgi:hypothetical protein